MQIIGRNPTPDLYSISDVRVRYNTAELRNEDKGTITSRSDKRTVVWKLLVLVDLKPEGYFRERGFGDSYEKKKNACTLKIEQNELEEIQEALRKELKDAYQFLMDKDLFAEFAQHRKQLQSDPFGDLPDANQPDEKPSAA